MPNPNNKKALFDNHGRLINYVRLAVTDRCNLRCFYCMPEEGIEYVSRQELMTYEEMERLLAVLAELGIQKVRITGGEPFVRRGMFEFMERVSRIPGIEQLHLTTNGTLTKDRIGDLKRMGLRSVNLSLDSLDRQRFLDITRRDALPSVMATFHGLLQHGIQTKINAVVMDGKNTDDLLSMAELTREHPIGMRFIEEMPFNGAGQHYTHLKWNHRYILRHLKKHYPNLEKIPDPPHSTSSNYRVPGYAGTIGIIAAYSRSFCGSCNRIRITPKGLLKTCLYDDGVFNIRDIMRAGATDEQLKATFLGALANRAKDGFEAEQNRNFGRPITESMSTIGG
ncbi:MAG: GTP 3',8-cyclase MoaA [Bacteroidota bacterium]